MASSLSQLSASVTRILSLTGFPKELKTRDIQLAFSEWENANGGFKIKWIDDTSLLIVFADAIVAKRAYLSILANPPAIFSSPTSDAPAIIRPYDGPDAQAIIQNVNSRGQNSSRGHNGRSISIAISSQRTRSNGNGASVGGLAMGVNGNGSTDVQMNVLPGSGPISPIGREGSPSLPSLPSHPTLDSLISSTLTDGSSPPTDPAIVAISPQTSAPRIGDPGKRMLGAALGVRHPGLAPRQVGNAEHSMKEMQRAMGGLTVAE
ncbi:hypothetical protein DFH94DRAFT_734963 [Russula ochroleuca]|jgi:hypothetical protein|uniref:Uncharacterized protein n=1 Tax=Russula ochroleuca TaxID=152965 RepID=A0A9P5MYU8_9AGAM|nr:hypothetical protein DFH94DRAFT_734963 [Russula ochroleuca]